MSDKHGDEFKQLTSGTHSGTVRSRNFALQIALARWAGWMQRAAMPVVLLMIALSAFTLRFTIEHLGISTDTSNMLSPELEFRQTYADYRQSFPQHTDTMIVVVTGDTPDLASAASSALARSLRDSGDLFKSVYLPGTGEFFEKNAFLYLDLDALEDAADNLVRMQALIGALAQNTSLQGLFGLSAAALERAETETSLEIEPFLIEIDAALAAANDDRFYQVSWQHLLGSHARGADRRHIIILQPRLDYTVLQPAAGAMQLVRTLAEELQLDPAHGIQIQITGEVALAHEELQSASRGAAIAGILSLIMVAVVLGVGLGSWQLVIATVVTLSCGLIMTAGFAAVAIGHLNLISIAFAVLYIGLGVDYAIHLCLRYRELMRQQLEHGDALRQAMCDIGGSLIICTATTATGFYAFVPTAFTGVSELGLISGSGMIISLVVSLCLLPALLSILPPIRPGNRTQYTASTVARRWLRAPAQYPRQVLWLATGAGFATLLAIQFVHFDSNPINLRNPASESVRAFNELLASSSSSPWNINILADNKAEAHRLSAMLRELPSVKDTVIIDRFIPSRQTEKLALISNLSLLLGPLSSGETSDAVAQPRMQKAALQKFAVAVQSAAAGKHGIQDLTRRLHGNLQQFLSRLAAESASEQELHLLELEQRLLGSLPSLFERLARALQATEIRPQDLPDELLQRWVSNDERYRIDVIATNPLLDSAELDEFVKSVRSIAPNATGPAVFNIESGKVVVAAFTQALLSALAAITILLLILLPRKRDTLFVLLPLLLAAMITAGATVIFGIAFNFANVIALPLLLGIGVDSGVHMVHRYRTAMPVDGDLLGSSTIRAIIVSALTTVCSFGNLAFSPHPGAASMGLLLAIGTVATLLCMLFVLPALLYRQAPLATETVR